MKILFRENTGPCSVKENGEGQRPEEEGQTRDDLGLSPKHICSQEKSPKNEISELVMRFMERTNYWSESKAVEEYHLNVPIGFRTREGEKITSDWQTSTPLNDSVPSKKG